MAGKGSLTALRHVYERHLRGFGKRLFSKGERRAGRKLLDAEKAMAALDLPREIPLARIEKVTFYKLDEITTDLICCAVTVDGGVWTVHEEMACWDALLRHVEQLPGFRSDWYAAVAQPAFETCETVAFSRGEIADG